MIWLSFGLFIADVGCQSVAIWPYPIFPYGFLSSLHRITIFYFFLLIQNWICIQIFEAGSGSVLNEYGSETLPLRCVEFFFTKSDWRFWNIFFFCLRTILLYLQYMSIHPSQTSAFSLRFTMLYPAQMCIIIIIIYFYAAKLDVLLTKQIPRC